MRPGLAASRALLAALAIATWLAPALRAQMDKPTSPRLPDAPVAPARTGDHSVFAHAGAASLPTERTLVVAKRRIIQGPTFSQEGEAQCDDDGNLYFHVEDGVSSMDPTILKIGHSGDDHQLYRPQQDKSVSFRFLAFSVTSDGRPWVLTIAWIDGKASIVVLGFADDGTVAHNIALEVPPGFQPRQFAVFDDDTFFAAGSISSGSESQAPARSFAALFEPSGKLTKTIDLDLSKLRIQKGKIPEGFATTGRDGNLYLLLTDKIVVISKSGEIAREILYSRPLDGAPTRLAVSAGRLAVWLSTPTKTHRRIETNLLLLDRSTGEEIGFYHPSDELGNNPVCFSSEGGFTFMRFIRGSADGSIQLLQAQVR